MKKIHILVFAFLIMAGCTAVPPQKTAQPEEKTQQQGQTAQAGTQPEYTVEYISDISSLSREKANDIRFKILTKEGKTLSDYEIAHEKIMHFIIVRTDLGAYQHIHPEYDARNGEFSVTVLFPEEGTYRAFADFTPSRNVNPDEKEIVVFNDLIVGKETKPGTLAGKPEMAEQGKYKIEYFFPETMSTNESIVFGMNVQKDGKPTDITEAYLGAKAHSVILNTKTLDFIHTHANEGHEDSRHQMMELGQHEMMTEMEAYAKTTFPVTFPTPGSYRVYTEFMDEGQVITTYATVTVDAAQE